MYLFFIKTKKTLNERFFILKEVLLLFSKQQLSVFS